MFSSSIFYVQTGNEEDQPGQFMSVPKRKHYSPVESYFERSGELCVTQEQLREPEQVKYRL